MDKRLIALTIIFMAPLAGMGIDIYSPALPMMQKTLHIDAYWGGLTMTIYLIGYALGLFVAGPLSDSLGRVKVLSIGLYAYIVICLAILFVHSISLLMFMRLLQGVAVAAPGVMFKVLISDHFDEAALPKMSNNASIAWALGPVLAPFIGGVLAHHVGWHASFGFLACYACGILVLRYTCLVESNPNPTPLRLKALLSGYVSIIKHRVFILYVVLLSLSYSVFILFNVNGPFLIQKTLGLSAMSYGSIALILGLSYFIGITLNRFLIHRLNEEKITIVGFFGVVLGAIALLVSGLLGFVSLSVIMMGAIVAYFSVGFIIGNVLSRCMLLFRDRAGTANAVMNAAFVSGSALVSAFGSHLPFESQVPLGIAYLFIGLACGYLYLKSIG